PRSTGKTSRLYRSMRRASESLRASSALPWRKMPPPSPRLSSATSSLERRIAVWPQPSYSPSSPRVVDTTYFGRSAYAAWSSESRQTGANASLLRRPNISAVVSSSSESLRAKAPGTNSVSITQPPLRWPSCRLPGESASSASCEDLGDDLGDGAHRLARLRGGQ